MKSLNREYCRLIYLDFLKENGGFLRSFIFVVKAQNAVDVMQHLIYRLSELHLTNVRASMGEDIMVPSSEVWTPEAIDACLNENLLAGNILTRKQGK